MKISTILKRAKKKIEKPARWCQESSALDRKGVRPEVFGTKPYAHCATGAIQYVKNVELRYQDAVNLLADCLPARWRAGYAGSMDAVQQYNDAPTRKHSQVLRLFDRAIAKAERLEQRRRAA